MSRLLTLPNVNSGQRIYAAYKDRISTTAWGSIIEKLSDSDPLEILEGRMMLENPRKFFPNETGSFRLNPAEVSSIAAYLCSPSFEGLRPDGEELQSPSPGL